MFVVMAGLPASGKSTIATILQERLDAVLLDKDSIRALLFGQYTEYSREQDDLCMETVYSTADFLVRKHPQLAIILDGRTYSKAYQVDAVRGVAANAGTGLRFIECVCSELSAKDRLKKSVQQNSHPAADRDFALYLRSRAGAEPLPEPKLTINTDVLSLDDSIRLALDYLGIQA